MERLINIFLTSRPKQQFKNILVIIPFVLSANLWIGISSQIISNLVSDLLMGLASFVLGSWFIYIINDSVDKNTDKGHPEKSKRPIVSGKLSGKVASTILSSPFLTPTNCLSKPFKNKSLPNVS